MTEIIDLVPIKKKQIIDLGVPNNLHAMQRGSTVAVGNKECRKIWSQ